METSPTVSTAPHAAVTQVHWQSLLVMVVGCGAAAATVAAHSGTWCGQSGGTLHRAAGLLKWHGGWGLWCWVMEMVKEVMSITVTVVVAVTVAVAVAMLRAAGLLGG